MTDSSNRTRNDLLINSRVEFIARWNAAREAKLAAYVKADAAWHVAIEAGAEHEKALEARRSAIAKADDDEHAALDSAGKAYSSAIDTAKTIITP